MKLQLATDLRIYNYRDMAKENPSVCTNRNGIEIPRPHASWSLGSQFSNNKEGSMPCRSTQRPSLAMYRGIALDCFQGSTLQIGLEVEQHVLMIKGIYHAPSTQSLPKS